MEYENDFEFAEYNPKAIELEKEMKTLAKMIKLPEMSFFQKLMRKLVISNN